MRSLAYAWDSIKLQRIGKSLKMGDQRWAAAADLALWCLQGNPSRRPTNMQEVFQHKFFDAAGGELQLPTTRPIQAITVYTTTL